MEKIITRVVSAFLIITAYRLVKRLVGLLREKRGGAETKKDNEP